MNLDGLIGLVIDVFDKDVNIKVKCPDGVNYTVKTSKAFCRVLPNKFKVNYLKLMYNIEEGQNASNTVEFEYSFV